MNPQILRQLRKEHCLSQKQLAQAIGVSTSAIGMYEQGRREPDHETLLKLARFFKTSVDFLMDNGEAVQEIDRDVLADELFHRLMEQNALMFRSEKLTEEDYRQVADAIKIAVDMTIQRKKK